ncbi:hypothetical protein RCC89_15815 [Cytophagaceae bacterium ABcell3]|nr:hypothetical protein RCC89_15815 [Cytophagaceae bacterium ABcell3]
MEKEKYITGSKILTAVYGMTVVSGYVADWNRTHLFNPRWTPHSKFHDALSILMATMNGASSLYFLHKKSGDRLSQLNTSVLFTAIPCVSMGLAYAFPGAKGLEAEFPKLVPKIGKVYLSEWVVSVTGLALLAIGYAMEKETRKRAFRKKLPVAELFKKVNLQNLKLRLYHN